MLSFFTEYLMADMYHDILDSASLQFGMTIACIRESILSYLVAPTVLDG